MKKEQIIKVIDITVLIAIGSLCGIFIFLGLFGEKKVDYSLLSATLLFAVVVHLILSAFLESSLIAKHEALNTKIESSTKTIIDSLQGIEIKLFPTIKEVDLYIAERIQGAQKSVYDLNWQDYLESNPNPRNPVDRKYTENAIDKSIKKFCASKSFRTYREIFTFSYPNNFGKMKTHLQYGENYSCKYYDTVVNPKFPKLQFVIIDDIEVIFVSSAYRPNFCSIKDKRIVSIFDNYFEQAWALGTTIKDRDHVLHELITEIETNYGKS